MYNLRSTNNNLPLPLRSWNRWTIPELIALEREYDLLELTVLEIAQRHNRTESAIVSRLELEGFLIES
jgi:hypothetical protein